MAEDKNPKNEDSKSGGTPIGDEVQRELEQLDELDGDDGEGEDVPGDGDIPFAAKSFKVDVKRALERETQDGPGDDEIPESDWQGYATEGVEVED